MKLPRGSNTRHQSQRRRQPPPKILSFEMLTIVSIRWIVTLLRSTRLNLSIRFSTRFLSFPFFTIFNSKSSPSYYIILFWSYIVCSLFFCRSISNLFSLPFYCFFFLTSPNKVSVIHCTLFTTSSIYIIHTYVLKNTAFEIGSQSHWSAECRVFAFCYCWFQLLLLSSVFPNNRLMYLMWSRVNCIGIGYTIYGIVFIFHRFFYFMPRFSQSFIHFTCALALETFMICVFSRNGLLSVVFSMYVLCINRWYCLWNII